MVALWNRADHYIFMMWFVLLLSSFFPRLISAAADCTRVAENTGRKKVANYKARIDNRKKRPVKQQYVLHMFHNMVNFDLLAAEIG